MKGYQKEISYEQYEKDYVEELKKQFKDYPNKEEVSKYIDDVVASGYIKEVYQDRLKGWKDGKYNMFYVDVDWQLHNMSYPEW